MRAHQAAERIRRRKCLSFQLLWSQILLLNCLTGQLSLAHEKESFMTTAQAESTIPTGTWQSDPIHSHVGFAVKHVVGTFRGSFGEFEATLSDASGKPQLSGHVPVESVQVKEENLQGHLLSPEFFDAEKTPEISFQSTEIAVEDGQIV